MNNIGITDIIIGTLVWICVAVISYLVYIKLVISSWIVMAIPMCDDTTNVAVHMTKLVSHYGFREETHDISGVKIHCVVKDPLFATATDTTDTSTDVFVFIHGTASSSAAFFDTMKALPCTMKCVAIDLPTFGVSGHIDTERYPTNEKLCIGYADVIGHTLHQMEIVEKTILVAHSLGGFLSIYVANRFPIKKLILLNPAGILPTLGVYGYYWGMFFKAGLPTTIYHLPMVSSEVLTYLARWWWTGNAYNHNDPNIEFWLSFYSNPANEGHRILQRLITLRPFYSYWNTPAISTLTDVYKKVPTSICFGVEDTIIPSHIGSFLRRLTQGEIRIHNIQNANHNPCTNIQCMVKVLVDTCNDSITKPERSWHNKVEKNNNEIKCLQGYSYPLLEKTQASFQNVYDYILTNTNSTLDF
jgi:pimeloyl-ACP methyl ester carboxylesterase